MPTGIYKRKEKEIVKSSYKGFTKGYTPWNKGKKCPYISMNQKGRIPWNKGIKMSDVQKFRLSNSLKGKLPWNKGLHNPLYESQMEYRINKLEKIAGRPKPATCEICNDGSSRICFDHDHATGHFRGWICNGCNTTLGLIRDRKEVLYKMIEYLSKKNDVLLTEEQLLKFGFKKKSQVPIPK